MLTIALTILFFPYINDCKSVFLILTDADEYSHCNPKTDLDVYIAALSVSVGFNALLIATVVGLLWYSDSELAYYMF